MPLLKTAFLEIGLLDVITYINSGNVIFTSSIKDKNELIKNCEEIILDKFTLNIPVTIVTVKELANTVSNTPKWWNIDKEAVNYAIFPIPPTTIEEIHIAVGEIKPEYEQIGNCENIIFWSAPKKTFNKAKWSKIASSSVNNNVTIRNANTVNKLLALAK